MSVSTLLFAGGAGLFLAFSISQMLIVDRDTRRIYLHYSAYLFSMLLYFISRSMHNPSTSNQWESVLFSTAAICYLLFAKAMFKGRQGYSYISSIADMTIYVMILCIVLEKILHLLLAGHPEAWNYIKVIESILRAFICALGLYIVIFMYVRYPADRSFSSFFLAGNCFILCGGILAALTILIPLFAPNALPGIQEWGPFNRISIMQSASLLEILCFSIAIARRQSAAYVPYVAVAAVSGAYHVAIEAVPPASDSESTQPDLEDAPDPASGRTPDTGTSQRIAFRTNKGFELMKKSDIVFIQGGGNGANFIKVYREGRTNPVIALHTLAHTFLMLSEADSDFQQPHRSYILNVQKISRLYRDEDGVMMAVMDNDIEVPVSAERVPAIKALLGLE